MGGHPLDNPFWHSLSDVQAHVANVFGPARRYRRDCPGRGLGAAVTHHVTQHIVDQGQRPFLHVAHGNDARRLYERLGYTVRTQIDFVLLAFSP